MQSGSDTRKVVLVVDDYEEIRIMLRKALELRGCRVVEAGDGEEAVRVALSERPDIILMDVWMPRLSGVSAVQQIRREPSMSGVPVIALTAYEAVDLHIKAIQAGCDHYLVKPINLDDLHNLLNRYLPVPAEGGR